MLKEIGSNHPYLIENLSENINITPFIYGYKGTDYKWLSSGRGAQNFVLKDIENKNPNIKKLALLPPYTCHTVFNPYYENGYEVDTYDIDKHFISSKEMILKRVDEVKPSIVLLQRYFGFETLPQGEELVKELKKRNIIVIEDVTQSILSNHTLLDVDYYVGSVRKYFGVPDGGFAICRDGKFSSIELHESDKNRIENINKASKLKYDYIYKNIGEKKEFLDLYRKGENSLDGDSYLREISDVSLKIQSHLDRDSIRKIRNINYKLLINELKDVKEIEIVLNDLKENYAPLYLPLYVKGNRIKLQKYLVEASIYAPIVWPKPERIPNNICNIAEDFYNSLICIPIDQRYDELDMLRIADRIKRFYGIEKTPDIFYKEKWRELYSKFEGDGFGFYEFNHKDGTIIYPYVKRKTPDNNYYDIVTPYGFNGPAIVDKRNNDLTNLLKDFNEDFKAYCRKEKIIAEYVRFCPWTKNVEYFKDLYDIRPNNQTVAIDLTVDDILKDEISSKRRNQIRLAIKKQVQISFDFNGETVENFYNLYQNTIKKNDIGEAYNFSLDFLKKHFDYLKGNCWIANASADGKIISSAFVLMCGDNMHYHLSANDYDMTEYNGNSLLLYEIAKLGKGFGCKYLHLGGIGVGKKSLMDFKTSFTKKGIFDFYVGSRIVNKEVYDKLVKEYNKGSNYFPAYRG